MHVCLNIKICAQIKQILVIFSHLKLWVAVAIETQLPSSVCWSSLNIVFSSDTHLDTL